MADPLRDARARVERSLYLDGLTEAAIGVQQLLIGGWLLTTARTSGGSPGYQALTLAYLLLFSLYMLFLQRILRAIRLRFTYPRTGYVALQDPGKVRRYTVAAIAGLVVIVVGVLAAYFHDSVPSRSLLRWLPAALGLLSGAPFIVYGLRLGLLRFWLCGAFSIILGPAVCFVGVDPRSGTGIYFTGMGGALLISGAVTAWRYAQTPPPREEAA